MPMQRELYPENWDEIAEKLKEAARYTCQQCGAQRGQRVANRHGEMVDVVITVAHLDHDPNNPRARLAVLCSACHIRYDTEQRARKRHMMAIARGQLLLPYMQAWHPP